MEAPFKKKVEYWQGCELTWTTKKDIKDALIKKGLPIDTPLKGVSCGRVKIHKGADWKVLMHKEDQSSFILYKAKKKK